MPNALQGVQPTEKQAVSGRRLKRGDWLNLSDGTARYLDATSRCRQDDGGKLPNALQGVQPAEGQAVSGRRLKRGDWLNLSDGTAR